jgi:alpha-glucosidase (family GH31 glycosyl hydrolase)
MVPSNRRANRLATGLVATAAAVLAFGASGAAADDARTVTARSLRATVSPHPWHVDFTDARGGAVLSEARDTGLGPSGTLGFSTQAGWFHATRVLTERREGANYVAQLATTDPLGRRLDVRISPDAEGVIALSAAVTGGPTGDVTATGMGFDVRPGERYLGFGERSNAVDQRGQTVENYVAEGPYQPSERAAVTLFVPPPGYRQRDDATYFPMPWLLSTAGYGVLVDNNETSYFRLGSDRAGAWSLEAQADRIALRVFAGPHPADVLRRLSARLGRQPPAAAPLYFGPWYQPPRGVDDAASIAALRRADAPVSVGQTYTHYLPCGDQRGREAAERARTAAFHGAGLAVTTYFNPMICTQYSPVYDRAKAQRVLTRNQFDQPYEYRYTGSSQFFVGQFDFSAPGATRFYGDLLDEAVGTGYDGWMEDFGEYTPTDARSANGMNGLQMHNFYPVLYHGAARDYAVHRAPRPLARFNRSGWTGAARHSQIVWGGDPSTSFGFDGLESAVKNGLTMGVSGVSLWGSDIGGFFSISSPELTPELLIRWLQFGAASGVMRTQANGSTIPPKPQRRAQIFDPEVLPVWRRYAKLRTQLYPYLAGAEAEYDRSGLPIMRHLSLAYPDDPAATAREDEYLFGPDLLAAPVLAPGARTRGLYLPRGRWVDLWRSARFLTADGSLALGRASVLDGGREVSVPAPLEELPLLVRAGAVIPMLAPDVQTLADYGADPGIVHLRDRAGVMRLLAFPSGGWIGALGPGERALSRERRGRWVLSLRARRTRTYELQATLSTLRRPFRPCTVYAGGRPLSRGAWSYDAASAVLRARFALRSGTVVASATCARRAERRPAQHRSGRRPAARRRGSARFTG